MLDNCKDNRERWQAVEGLLQGWLKERRELLVKYAAIAGYPADQALAAAGVSDNVPYAVVGFCLGARAVYRAWFWSTWHLPTDITTSW